MKQKNKFVWDMLDMDLPQAQDDILRMAGVPVKATKKDGDILLKVPFHAFTIADTLVRLEEVPDIYHNVIVRAYSGGIVRLSLDYGGEMLKDKDNIMLSFASDVQKETLSIVQNDEVWSIVDRLGCKVMELFMSLPAVSPWGENKARDLTKCFSAHVYAGKSTIKFMPYDAFNYERHESVSLGYMERQGAAERCIYSLHAKADEKFCGTGERFAGMNLSGRTLLLENGDALGVNNRRAYKNIPFYLSSEGYGLLIMSSAHIRLSFADISTRAAQGLIEDNYMDLFFIGGENPERIVNNYRRLTGFPSDMPLWSYGTWMSRMTYYTAEETRIIADRLRSEKYPCDVIHLDTGWFEKDWQCEWRFSKEKFPDPPAYMKEMREKGYRITLWQLPAIGKDTIHFETAKENHYLAPKTVINEGSNFGQVDWAGNIDFSNPDAVLWYKELLRPLLEMGASAIKTDFGEIIDPCANYAKIPYKRLHNLYALLYQKAAYEITKETTGEGIIWARAGWTGCQRYPLHWGGDAASTFDGLAGSIKGGLHLGVSGFGFWSHDVPGFHGIPDFMSSKPEDDLYVRWTQFGVLSSHLRYHGSYPREPYEYPNVCDIVREWLKLRYALIPYIAQQGTKLIATGYPMMCPLLMRHSEEKICWYIDDQYYFGEECLVAPILGSEGVRDVYLPDGTWVDFWSGEKLQGGKTIKKATYSLCHMPIFVRQGASIPVYPEYVSCTDEMDMAKVCHLVFDDTYKGFSKSLLGEYIAL